MQIIYQGPKLWQPSTCSAFHKYIQVAENSMTGRAYMGEVLIQVWLRNELLDKQVNAQEESSIKNFQGSRKFPQAHKKCAMKMKEEKTMGA